MRMTSDTRYPQTQRIRVYDDELAAYYRIVQPGERIIFENRAAKSSNLILILPDPDRL